MTSLVRPFNGPLNYYILYCSRPSERLHLLTPLAPNRRQGAQVAATPLTTTASCILTRAPRHLSLPSTNTLMLSARCCSIWSYEKKNTILMTSQECPNIWSSKTLQHRHNKGHKSRAPASKLTPVCCELLQQMYSAASCSLT